MPADSIDISGLSAGERIALMERLWRSLSEDVRIADPPAWHEAELGLRQAEWEGRHACGEDWPVVREELRRELQ